MDMIYTVIKSQNDVCGREAVGAYLRREDAMACLRANTEGMEELFGIEYANEEGNFSADFIFAKGEARQVWTVHANRIQTRFVRE